MDNILQPVATTAPPIQSRPDHPLAWRGIDASTRQSSGPLQTNKFYANLLLSEQDCPAYPMPYSVSWAKGRGPSSSWGLAVSHVTAEQRVFGPPAPGCQHGETTAGYYFNPPLVQNVVLDAAELGLQTALTLENVTDLSVMVNLGPPGQAPTVQYPLVQGQGFVTGLYSGATPIVRSAMAITDVDDGGGSSGGTGRPVVGLVDVRRFVLHMNDGAVWLLYARPRPGTAPLVLQRTANVSELASPRAFYGSLQVARAIPEVALEPNTVIYDRSAGVYATGVRLAARTTADAESSSGLLTGRYTFEFVKNAVGRGTRHTPLLMFALPHHRASFDRATRAASTYLTLLTTTKGDARAVAADAWTMVEPDLPLDIGFLPWNAWTRQTVRTLPRQTQQQILQIARRELAEDMDAQTDLNSMYFSGKALAKFALIVLCVHELLDDAALAAAGLAKLQAAFARFAENRQQFPLVYESAWGGVVSTAAYTTGDAMADFGNAYYNDHHFHYGYLVYAGAVLGHLDAQWLAGNGAYIDMLARDYANPSRQDGFFPVFRSFDWYHGHSWAHGLFASMDGKDQESSSEDALSVYAMMLWGGVRGDAGMAQRAALMLAVLARALQTYYYYEPGSLRGRDDAGQVVQPGPFAANRVAGILMENKIDHTTYFGAVHEYIHGIHMLPLLPCSPLCRPPSFVAAEWTEGFSGGRADVEGGWRGVLYGNLATADARAAWAFFSRPDFDSSWLDGGASRTWYLCYAAALGGV